MDYAEEIFNRIKSSELTLEEFTKLMHNYGLGCYDDGFNACYDNNTLY